MRIAPASLLVTLAACQPAGKTAAPEPKISTIETQEAEPAPPSGPLVLGVVELSQPLRALGTEPFWDVEIKPDELTYSGVDRPQMKMANPGPSLRDGSVVIPARRTDGQPFTVTLRAIECSDGMSDRVYPLEAEVLYKGETMKGCANSLAALDVVPKP